MFSFLDKSAGEVIESDESPWALERRVVNDARPPSRPVVRSPPTHSRELELGLVDAPAWAELLLSGLECYFVNDFPLLSCMSCWVVSCRPQVLSTGPRETNVCHWLITDISQRGGLLSLPTTACTIRESSFCRASIISQEHTHDI